MPIHTEFCGCDKDFLQGLKDLGFAPSCVFDIGASDGAWTRVVHPIFPEASYELFDPLAEMQPSYAGILKDYLGQHPKMRMHAVALGRAAGSARFWHQPTGVGSSLLFAKNRSEDLIDVVVHRLDDYRALQRLPQPEVVKMDVQGGERLILEGGPETIAHADVLMLETWLVRGYGEANPLLPELIEQLRPMGHRLVHLGEIWRRDDQELASIDAFFVHRRLIERLVSAGKGYPWPANWGSPGT